MAGIPQKDTNVQIDISFLLLNNQFSKVKSKRGIRRSMLQRNPDVDKSQQVF